MSLETIYYITQIIAVIAVVASLVFVGLQVRQGAEQTRLNTKAVKAAAAYEATHSWGTFNEHLMSWPEEKLVRFFSTVTPDKSWDDFNIEMQSSATITVRALFQKLEGQYYLMTYGSLDQEVFEGRLEFAASMIKLPFYEHWWEQEKLVKIYSDAFVQAIERRRAASDVSVSEMTLIAELSGLKATSEESDA